MSTEQAVLNALKEIRQGNVFFGSDFDGCLMPVHTDEKGNRIDPRRDVVVPEFRDAIAEYAERFPGSFGIVTGRGLLKEMPYFLAGYKTEKGIDALSMAADEQELFDQEIQELVEQTEFPGGIISFNQMIAKMPIMVASGNIFGFGNNIYEAPVPQNQHIPLQYALAVGELCEELSQKISQLTETKYQPLKDMFEFLYFRAQPGEFNINTQKVPEQYQNGVVKAVNLLLDQTRANIRYSAGSTVKTFARAIHQFTGIEIPTDLLKNLHSKNKDFAYTGDNVQEPLKIEEDAAGTVLKIKTFTDKGQNFIHWIESGLFKLEQDKKIVIISDNLQAGGSDRGLVDALIKAGFGPRLQIWQTLDSDPAKPKAPIADNDEFAQYRQFVFSHSSDLGRFFAAATNDPSIKPAALAKQIADNEFPGVVFVGASKPAFVPKPVNGLIPK